MVGLEVWQEKTGTVGFGNTGIEWSQRPKQKRVYFYICVGEFKFMVRARRRRESEEVGSGRAGTRAKNNI